MTEKVTLQELREHLSFFRKMYDVVRLVDPVRKRVVDCREKSPQYTDQICYDYWETGLICDNCISIRAHHDQQSFTKLEYKPESVLLVTAFPIDAAETPIVLELLKNATDSMMLGKGEYTEGRTFLSTIQDLNNMVVRDDLTSLYNRRFINDRLPADIVHATVERQPLSVIFLDVDNMKAVNDTLGHAVGDEVLKHAANTILSCIRTETDWAARYGGDEFIVCLKGVEPSGAGRISERIQHRFRRMPPAVRDAGLDVTVSQGMVNLSDSQLTAQEIIELADQYMYQDKKKKKEPAPPGNGQQR